METEEFPVSLELLRIMFSFVELLGKPINTTIDDNNAYHLEWYKQNNSILLRFNKDDISVNYVISKSKLRLYGSKSPLELFQYVKEECI